MKIYNTNEIIKKGNRYYKFSRMQARLFPVAKNKAIKMLKSGDFVLTDENKNKITFQQDSDVSMGFSR